MKITDGIDLNDDLKVDDFVKLQGLNNSNINVFEMNH